jgi:hypothetical protein
MSDVLALDIGGFRIPDAGPVFFTVLAIHVLAGATAMVAGILATTARKGPGRHPWAGTGYLYAITAVFVTATVLAILRWRQDWHLFLIATVAFGLAALGWWARRRRPRHWLTWHGCAMAGSYVALFTGFYVDNGPQLPLWDRLPHLAYWFIPAAIGAPLTWRALARQRRPDTPPEPEIHREASRPPYRWASGTRDRWLSL